jgi:hypothetical protein
VLLGICVVLRYFVILHAKFICLILVLKIYVGESLNICKTEISDLILFKFSIFFVNKKFEAIHYKFWRRDFESIDTAFVTRRFHEVLLLASKRTKKKKYKKKYNNNDK